MIDKYLHHNHGRGNVTASEEKKKEALEAVRRRHWFDDDAFAGVRPGEMVSPFYHTFIPVSEPDAKKNADDLARLLLQVGVDGVHIHGPVDYDTFIPHRNHNHENYIEKVYVVTCSKRSLRFALPWSVDRDYTSDKPCYPC